MMAGQAASAKSIRISHTPGMRGMFYLHTILHKDVTLCTFHAMAGVGAAA